MQAARLEEREQGLARQGEAGGRDSLGWPRSEAYLLGQECERSALKHPCLFSLLPHRLGNQGPERQQLRRVLPRPVLLVCLLGKEEGAQRAFGVLAEGPCSVVVRGQGFQAQLSALSK